MMNRLQGKKPNRTLENLKGLSPEPAQESERVRPSGKSSISTKQLHHGSHVNFVQQEPRVQETYTERAQQTCCKALMFYKKIKIVYPTEKINGENHPVIISKLKNDHVERPTKKPRQNRKEIESLVLPESTEKRDNSPSNGLVNARSFVTDLNPAEEDNLRMCERLLRDFDERRFKVLVDVLAQRLQNVNMNNNLNPLPVNRHPPATIQQQPSTFQQQSAATQLSYGAMTPISLNIPSTQPVGTTQLHQGQTAIKVEQPILAQTKEVPKEQMGDIVFKEEDINRQKQSVSRSKIKMVFDKPEEPLINTQPIQQQQSQKPPTTQISEFTQNQNTQEVSVPANQPQQNLGIIISPAKQLTLPNEQEKTGTQTSNQTQMNQIQAPQLYESLVISSEIKRVIPESLFSNTINPAAQSNPISDAVSNPVKVNPFLQTAAPMVPQWNVPNNIFGPIPTQVSGISQQPSLPPPVQQPYVPQTTSNQQNNDSFPIRNLFAHDSTSLFQPQNQYSINSNIPPQQQPNPYNQYQQNQPPLFQQNQPPPFQQQQTQISWQQPEHQQQPLFSNPSFGSNQLFTSNPQPIWNAPQPPNNIFPNNNNNSIFPWNQGGTQYPAYQSTNVENPMMQSQEMNHDRNLSSMSFGPQHQQDHGPPPNSFLQGGNLNQNMDQAVSMFAPINQRNEQPSLFSAIPTQAQAPVTRSNINDSRMNTLRRNMGGDANQRIG